MSTSTSTNANTSSTTKKSLFNPLTRAFRENPYDLYAALQQQSTPERAMGMWIFTRYADVMAVLRDPRFSSASVPEITEKKMAEFSLAKACPEVTELGRKAIVFTENPDHQRLRRLTNPVFRESNVNAVVKPIIARLVAGMCAEIISSRSADIISALAEPLPYRTMTAWMGLPTETIPKIKEWTNDVRYFLEPSVLSKRRFEESYRSLLDFRAFFNAEIQKRKEAGSNDFIGMLMSARVDDDVLTEDEIIYACIFGFVAGTETTKALLGNATHLLVLHPDQLRLIHEGQVSIPNAANELTRRASPLQMTRRRCLEDLTLAGVRIAKDDDLLLCLGAANYDPNVFPEPEKLLLDRHNSERHIAFGYGLHVCLGAHLARLQLQAYLSEIASRKMTFSVDSEPEWIEHSFMLRGLKRLDASVTAGVGVQ
jgi:cytochrome P450